MGARQRILTIRLMEKVNADPVVAARLGIVPVNVEQVLRRQEAGKSNI